MNPFFKDRILSRTEKHPNFFGSNSGFTLIELMIVVSILAILGGLAVPAYINYVEKSKTSEAPAMLQSIVNLELAYIDRPRIDPTNGNELYTCWQVSANRHPVGLETSLSQAKVDWDAAAPPASFTILGFRPSGGLYYTYSMDAQVTAAAAFTIVPDGNGYCQDGNPTANNADLTNQPLRVRAAGNLDGDATIARFARIVTVTAGIPTVGALLSINELE